MKEDTGKRYYTSITVFNNERKALSQIGVITDAEIVTWLYDQMAVSLGRLLRTDERRIRNGETSIR